MEAWSRFHANYSRRTLGIIATVQRECTYPKPAKIRKSGEIGDDAAGGKVESHDV